MKRLIEKAAQHGCAAEVFSSSAAENTVEVDDNQLKNLKSNDTYDTILRVIRNGKIGLASSSRLNDGDNLLKNAMDTSEFGTEAAFAFPGSAKLPQPEIYDSTLASLSIEEMVHMATSLAAELQKEDPHVLATTRVSRVHSEYHLANTSGFDATFKKTVFAVIAAVNLTEGSNMLSVYDFKLGTHRDLDLNALVERILMDFRIARHNVALAAGEYPVIMSPDAMGNMLRPIIACLDGRAVVKGISPWKDRLGEQLFDETFNLYDDGTIGRSIASGNFDSEGVPMQRTPLVENGVIRNYLLNLQTSAQLKMAPTGNGSREGGNSPIPGTTTLTAPAGQTGIDDMIKGIKQGILVDQLMGAWAGNPYTGAINGNIALGYKIENGRRVGRVKDCMFSINAFEGFKSQFLGCSKELVKTPNAVLPYFLFDKVNISG